MTHTKQKAQTHTLDYILYGMLRLHKLFTDSNK